MFKIGDKVKNKNKTSSNTFYGIIRHVTDNNYFVDWYFVCNNVRLSTDIMYTIDKAKSIFILVYSPKLRRKLK